jgi:hypothetical protein
MIRRLSCLLAVGLLAACSSAPPPPRFPDIRFTEAPPIRLDVSSIDMSAQFQPTFQLPEVEQNFPVPPQRAIENWVHDQLKASDPGTGAHARVTIMDAKVQQVDLPLTEGIKGAFTKDQSARYDAHVAARVEIVDDHGLAVRSANAESSLSRTVAEGTTLNQRDQIWYDMTREMVGDLVRELERQINGTFYPYIIQ